VKLAKLREPKAACFFSFVEYTPNTNTSKIMNAYKHIQNMYLNVGMVEEVRKGKKRKKDRE
jgi:hypothetical protein